MEFANADRQQRRKLMMRSQPEQALECPRCASTNTKFCYYNNYSLSQPRYFCKGCRRYWTQGGSLRNVPVGGGCRKTKRPPSSSSSSSTATTSSSSSFSAVSSSSKKAQDYHHHHHHHHHHHQDLTITHSNSLLSPTLIPSLLPYDSSDDLTFPAFSRLQMQSLPMEEDNSNNSSNPSLHLSNTVKASAAPSNGFLDILSTGSAEHLYYGMATTGVSAGGGGGGLLSLEGAAGLLAGSGAAGSTAATGHGSSCKAMDGVLDNKVVSGLPWQDASMDPVKESWNGGVLGSSSLQGLINSSLL